MLLFTLFASLTMGAPLKNNITYSVQCDLNACSLSEGLIAGATAWGRFDDQLNQMGWGHLFITTAGAEKNETVEALGAGYLEGALTQLRIDQHYQNFVNSEATGGELDPAVWKFISDNEQWTRVMAHDNAKDPLWIEVGRLLSQLDGLYNGYAAQGGKLSHLQITLLQTQGDLDDIILAVNSSARPNLHKMTQAQRQQWELDRLHCSSIIKVDANYSELYAGHSMWWSYYAMLPIFKRYEIKGSGRAASKTMMPSYPGILSSTDDFYTMDSGLVSIETTLPVYNMSLYDLIRPSTLLFWVRVLVANRLAKSGPEWMSLFAQYNSGTYNNMWIVVDYNLFTPGKPLVPNTLWIAEQLPGYFHAEDQTFTLQYGYFPSYNRCMYPETRRLAGQDEMQAKYGNYYSYQLYSRAEIFRRDQATFTTIPTLQKAIRYNRFQTDPLSGGDSYGTLAARGDLEDVKFGGPRGSGAINGKLTSSALMQTQQVWAVSGPTHDDQPVFQWSTAPPAVRAVSHIGHPDRWDFPWVLMQLK